MASTELKLDTGDRVPNFVLPDVTGQNMMLYDMVRGGPIVLCFIPAPFDANRLAVRDLLRGLMNFQENFEALSAEIYVVTEGSVEENAGLAKKSHATFPILADSNGDVARRYLLHSMQGGRPGNSNRDLGPKFKTLVLDTNQRILTVIADGKPSEHGRLALIALQHQWFSGPSVPVGPTAPVLLVPNAIGSKLCRTLIARWNSQHEELGVTGAAGDAIVPERKRSLDHMVRDPELIGELSETLARKIGPEIKKVFTHVGRLGFEAFIIIGYDAMRGDFFGPHRDNLAPSMKSRRFAISLNLNDDFEGGALRFPEYGPGLHRFSAGTACVYLVLLVARGNAGDPGMPLRLDHLSLRS